MKTLIIEETNDCKWIQELKEQGLCEEDIHKLLDFIDLVLHYKQ